jgi:hypothetical protein
MRKVTCPNPNENTNCMLKCSPGRVCRSCSKSKNRKNTCIRCSKIFNYRADSYNKYCSHKCAQDKTEEEKKMSTAHLNNPKVQEKAAATRASKTVEQIQATKERQSIAYWSKTNSPEYLSKKSKTISDKIAAGSFVPRGNSKSGYFTTMLGTVETYHSLWELARMLELERGDQTWTKHHGIRIPYEVLGVVRNYVPDFLINNSILEEVKPKILFTYERNPEKFEAAKEYCALNNLEWRVTSSISEPFLEMAKKYHSENNNLKT